MLRRFGRNRLKTLYLTTNLKEPLQSRKTPLSSPLSFKALYLVNISNLLYHIFILFQLFWSYSGSKQKLKYLDTFAFRQRNISFVLPSVNSLTLCLSPTFILSIFFSPTVTFNAIISE